MRTSVPALIGIALLTGCSGIPGSVPTTVTETKTVTVTVTAPDGDVSPQPAGHWEPIVQSAAPAVVRIDTTDCEASGGMATGFLVGDGLVMTAAHVVKGAATISVRTEDGEPSSAVIWGIAENNDAALLSVPALSSPATLQLADALPVRGAELAVLGFPLWANTVQVSNGLMSGLPDSVDYADQHVDAAFTTNAETNGGNSGGPVLDATGNVVGMISGGQNWEDADHSRPVEGRNYVIPSTDLRPWLEKWSSAQVEVPLESCETDVEPGYPTESADYPVIINTDHPMAAEFAQKLYTFGLSINSGSYESAFHLYDEDLQARVGGLAGWSTGMTSSYWLRLTILDVVQDGDSYQVDIALRTNQAADRGPDGQTCSDWTLEYTFVPSARGWLVHEAKGEAVACPS